MRRDLATPTASPYSGKPAGGSLEHLAGEDLDLRHSGAIPTVPTPTFSRLHQGWNPGTRWRHRSGGTTSADGDARARRRDWSHSGNGPRIPSVPRVGLRCTIDDPPRRLDHRAVRRSCPVATCGYSCRARPGKAQCEQAEIDRWGTRGDWPGMSRSARVSGLGSGGGRHPTCNLMAAGYQSRAVWIHRDDHAGGLTGGFRESVARLGEFRGAEA